MSDTIISLPTAVEKFNKTPHPCGNCENPCYGEQCQDCHKKMIASRLGDCSDCGEKFSQLRKDGSKRKRCQKCQALYNEKHIAICEGCNNSYHANLPDGRSFDRCFDCYKASFHKCLTCDNNIRDKFTSCSDCYKRAQEEKRNQISEKYPVHECTAKGCTNMTSYPLCKTCNDSARSLESQYRRNYRYQ